LVIRPTVVVFAQKLQSSRRLIEGDKTQGNVRRHVGAGRVNRVIVCDGFCTRDVQRVGRVADETRAVVTGHGGQCLLAGNACSQPSDGPSFNQSRGLGRQVHRKLGVTPQQDVGAAHRDHCPQSGVSSFQRDRKRVESVTRRRKVTPEFLSQVAEVYNGAPVGGRIAAIRTAFVVSERQALRYKKQAEEMELIDG
jgi:hypothetical protein